MGSTTPRLTRQQVAIRDLLADTGEFRSAQDLHEVLRGRGERIGLATVYRALGRMTERGEVDALIRPDGETLYRSCSAGHHHHLVCRSCGRTEEVSGSAVETWTHRVAQERGFTQVSHTLEIFGLCVACSAG